MLKVLIVDDDPAKTSQVKLVLDAVKLDEFSSIDVAASVAEAGMRLAAQYDLLVLDLNIPMRDKEDPREDGGVRLLENIKLGMGLRRPSHIIGLTAYDELHRHYASEFRSDGWYLIVYDATSNEWAQMLGRRLLHIAESKSSPQTGPYGIDLVVITALDVPELQYVLALPGEWRREQTSGDDTVYHRGRFCRGEVVRDVVACSATDMGMAHATALAMKVIERFRPRYLAMTGIAAGVKGRWGDVLVADQSWDYGSGKSRYRWPCLARLLPALGRPIFEPAPVPVSLSPLLKARIGLFNLRNPEVLANIRKRWSGGPPHWPIGVHVGPMASGAAVLEDLPRVAEIRRHNRKLIGIEMEIYGLFVACRMASDPRPQALAVKSICDFADSRKNDDWRAYAAFTSAWYLYEFALAELGVSGEPCSPR